MGRWLALCLALPPWLAGCGPSVATGGPDASGPAPGDGPCAPGAAFCAGDTSMVCRADGSGHDALFCDPVQGVGCDLDSGRCQGPCAPQFLTRSYIGCAYYPPTTGH